MFHFEVYMLLITTKLQKYKKIDKLKLPCILDAQLEFGPTMAISSEKEKGINLNLVTIKPRY